MIRLLTQAWDNLLGAGEAAVTVPPLDGAFQPNHRLDEAPVRLPLESVGSLTAAGGSLYAAAGKTLYSLVPDNSWKAERDFDDEIACLASLDDGSLIIAFVTGEILLQGGRFDGHRYPLEARAITALAAAGTTLYIANGSATNAAADWQRDLLERNASGSILELDLQGGAAKKIAEGLAWPAGLAVDGDSLVVSEAWRHQLVRVRRTGDGVKEILYADMPAYPGRITLAAGGHWLSLFAPRSQLVEFVLREKKFRKSMLADLKPEHWISPTLRAGKSFYEPLQGGGVKHFGELKPWAPTMSSGICAQLDADFRPASCLHSRANGHTHGVTDMAEYDGSLYAAAKGDNVVVAIPLDALGEVE